ncbi:MAG: hypothetical protein ACRD8O_22375 [Bryobacteraceae bacterium]
MTSGFRAGVKRFVLWDYPRASWQYDVMVAIILAFIFLTPREWFRDQARIPTTSSIAVLPDENGSNMYFVDPEILKDVPEAERTGRLTEILTARAGKRLVVRRIQPVVDEVENELKCYVAFAR